MIIKLPISIQLDGNIALITGAGSGIGRSIALEMSRAGATVLVNDVTAANCKGTVLEIEKTGAKAAAFAADITNRKEVERMVDDAVHMFGGLDILVNNAGVVVRKNAVELSEEEWDRVLDVNLKGTFNCSQSVARSMINRGCGGKIVSISSIMGEVALPPRAAYCASKGGIDALTKDLAQEFAENSINVNAIAPGWVRTNLTEKYFAQENVSAYLIQRIPLRRFCEPSEVAGLAVFLCSDYANYITGQIIAIDGGWTSQ